MTSTGLGTDASNAPAGGLETVAEDNVVEGTATEAPKRKKNLRVIFKAPYTAIKKLADKWKGK